jgi:hydrogenase/urease accessory protein HupE
MAVHIARRGLRVGWARTGRVWRIARYPVASVGAVAPILAQTREAHAHLVTTGLGPFYDGLTHFFLSSEDAIAVFALALLAGLSAASTSRIVLLTLPVAWFAGGILGLHASPLPLFPWLTIATFVALGLLIAVNVRMPTAAVGCMAVVLGLVHGFMNGSTMTAIGAPMTVLAGIVTSLFVVAAIVAAVVASLQAPWTRIGVRALGSWIAAGGLLVLGWALRGVA